MPGGHEVLAHEQRPPVEDADAPVEFGGQIFLGDDQLGFLQQRVDLLEQFLLRLHLDHAERERAVRLLEHARQPEVGDDLVDVVAVHHQRSRRGNVVSGEQLGEIDLVVALEDGVRIVDHHQAFRGRPPREAVGVVIGEGGVADEQGVELGQPGKIGAGDEFHVQSHALRGLLEFLQGTCVGRRLRVVGVVQDGEVETRRSDACACAAGGP